ncbi:endonuclease toxin domain-containing protein [Photorhabdus tasmaniensis]|uniref:endonuclease toxin domain-containing protein n=1 Tax=Photorhabdus tasmaniensis TaxID=1004159 RepID=UPI00105BC1DC|nr:hypothetical protein [Photorhabdus tasmaniensis]
MSDRYYSAYLPNTDSLSQDRELFSTYSQSWLYNALPAREKGALIAKEAVESAGLLILNQKSLGTMDTDDLSVNYNDHLDERLKKYLTLLCDTTELLANTTKVQWTEINRAIEYGKNQGVKVIVTQVKR